jgi:hypothetical protein
MIARFTELSLLILLLDGSPTVKLPLSFGERQSALETSVSITAIALLVFAQPRWHKPNPLPPPSQASEKNEKADTKPKPLTGGALSMSCVICFRADSPITDYSSQRSSISKIPGCTFVEKAITQVPRTAVQ